uniref:Uncharacterized protein n=1 Tax=Arundo donax TaxID=35708 RepID=A0A0A8YJR6_ARUDO
MSPPGDEGVTRPIDRHRTQPADACHHSSVCHAAVLEEAAHAHLEEKRHGLPRHVPLLEHVPI